METNILLTGVTGFVGRFVLHRLLETDTKGITVLIRSSGKRTAQQRFHEELVGHSLFAEYTTALQSVQVIDASIETLDTTLLPISNARCLIHCAANVKHYDPYEALERDNVENVKRIVRLAESLNVQTLLLLSTCYVHPKSATSRPPDRIAVSDDSGAFYNQYCYTKWRGEESVFESKSRIPNIQILRLSCVGAPSRAELLAHPHPAQAHLGILTLALRGYLESLYITHGSRISIIPVDCAANAIVAAANSTQSGITIRQLCPPPEAEAYHPPLTAFFAHLQSTGLESFTGRIRHQPDSQPLPVWKQALYVCHKKGRQSLNLHTAIQEFVTTFSQPDLRFESSLSETLPQIDVVRTTCEYAIRILHHRQLAKGIPASLSDRFWTRLAAKEPVQVCVQLKPGWTLETWPHLQKRLWVVCMSQRKCSAVLTDEFHWKQSRTGLDDIFAPPREAKDVAGILATGLHASTPTTLVHCIPFHTNEAITHLLFRFDHGLTDGIGCIPVLKEMAHTFELTPSSAREPSYESIKPPTKPAFWLDLWMGMAYLCLVAMLLLSPHPSSTPRSAMPSIATSTSLRTPTGSGGTFTSNILWNLTKLFTKATGEQDHVFAIPAALSVDRPSSELPTNDFVPLLLPTSAGMSREAFEQRCMLLRSRSVRFLSWCFIRLLEYGQWDEIRDRLLGSVRSVVSSLQFGDFIPPAVESIHVCTTTPCPFSIVAVTGGDSVYLTARSHDIRLPAEKIIAALNKT
jgi:nucleoside-diphosphate-sugar epimerase